MHTWQDALRFFSAISFYFTSLFAIDNFHWWFMCGGVVLFLFLTKETSIKGYHRTQCDIEYYTIEVSKTKRFRAQQENGGRNERIALILCYFFFFSATTTTKRFITHIFLFYSFFFLRWIAEISHSSQHPLELYWNVSHSYYIFHSIGIICNEVWISWANHEWNRKK